MSKPWFGVKANGIGVGPASTPGWIAVGIYLVAVSVAAPVVEAFRWPTWAIFVGIGLSTASLLLLAKIKGDGKPWRWRKGGS